MSDAPSRTSRRDQKRARTRSRIIAAGVGLIERDGYDETTIADIAEAADVAPRTFFSYFSSKDELLFPSGEARADAVLVAIERRESGDRPLDVLLRSLHSVSLSDDDMLSRIAALRFRLMKTVPAVRGRALLVQMQAQEEIATALYAAFSDELDRASAHALTGAFVGATAAVLGVLLEGEFESSPPNLDAAQQLIAAVSRALGDSPGDR